MKKVIIGPLLCCFVIGCGAIRPLKPGNSSIQSGIGTNGLPQFRSELQQPENPAQAAAQNFERVTEIELPLPAGTKVTERVEGGDGDSREKTIVLSEPTIQKTRITEKAGTTIGAAQKDAARELGAKLASLKGVVWVGVLLFVFGIASLAWPPLKAIVGSVTTSAAIILGGLALMVLPSVLVGNETLILGGVVMGVAAWFLAHRHGRLRGVLEATK